MTELKEKVLNLLRTFKIDDFRWGSIGYDYLMLHLFNCSAPHTQFEPKLNGNIIEYVDRYQDKMTNLAIDATIRNLSEKLNGFYSNIGELHFTILENGTIFGNGGQILLQIFTGEFVDYSEYFLYEKSEAKNKVYYAYSFQGQFFTDTLTIKNPNMDIKLNYNDDLPNERIQEILNSDKSGLILFNGIPGCGKSYYIRHLIRTIDKKFIYFNSTFFNGFSESSILNFLSNHKNTIFILEDCESLIASRDERSNSIATLLNMCDGIIGDSFNLKFICTYNTNTENIDEALLRKGRLSLKYEFKELASDKVVKLGEKLGIEIPKKAMPLCDIYNYEEDTGIKKTTQARIGF